MKKFIILMFTVVSIVWLYTTAQTRNGMVLTDTQAAIDFMYSNGLTKFNTTQTFMASQSLRRDEAAAFFARFARDVLGMTPDTSKTECNAFIDLAQGYQDLQWEVIASCQLGLFKGSNGKFMPTATFSNAHAVTVIVRLLNEPHRLPDDSGFEAREYEHRAMRYQSFASYFGLVSWLPAYYPENLDKSITRWEVARLIEGWSMYHEESIAMWKDIANVEYHEAQWMCINITSPILNDIVAFPLVIQGYINDPEIYWCIRWAIFENEAWHVYIQDTNGNTRSNTAILEITSDPYGWYPIQFQATINNLTSDPYTNEVNLKFSDNQQRDDMSFNNFMLPISIQ